MTSASTAVTNGQVAAAVISQPLTALDQATGKIKVLATGSGYLQVLGYLTASNAALANPQKAAALQDFIKRFYTASAILRKNPELAAETYVRPMASRWPVAKAAVASVQAVGTPITPAVISYQQNEANTFQKLGLIPTTLNVKSIFDLPFNKIVAKNSQLPRDGGRHRDPRGRRSVDRPVGTGPIATRNRCSSRNCAERPGPPSRRRGQRPVQEEFAGHPSRGAGIDLHRLVDPDGHQRH